MRNIQKLSIICFLLILLAGCSRYVTQEQFETKIQPMKQDIGQILACTQNRHTYSVLKTACTKGNYDLFSRLVVDDKGLDREPTPDEVIEKKLDICRRACVYEAYCEEPVAYACDYLRWDYEKKPDGSVEIYK